MQEVKACDTREQKLTILERGYPRMYIYVMTQLGELEVVKAYREKCKRFKQKYAES